MHDVLGSFASGTPSPANTILDVRRAVAEGHADLGDYLQALREQVGRHFAIEDEGGFLEEAIARCPGVAAAVTPLLAQHPELLSELDRLLDELTGGGPHDEWQRAFNQFIDRLLDHEQKECEIVGRAFGHACE